MLFLLIFTSFAQDLPDGPGKETVLKLCRDCHDLDTVTMENRTNEENRRQDGGTRRGGYR
jgi:hypothetical protein